jgi:hypothetical protein
MGMSLFTSFAIMMIIFHGIRIMLSGSPGDHVFEFVKLLFRLAFGYAMITFYDAPIPGIGISFTNLITDHVATVTNILDTSSIERISEHLDQVTASFIAPGAWEVLAGLIYYMLLVVIAGAKVLSMAIVQHYCQRGVRLLGPLFVPFYIVPQLEWFLGWFKSFLIYSFLIVVNLPICGSVSSSLVRTCSAPFRPASCLTSISCMGFRPSRSSALYLRGVEGQRLGDIAVLRSCPHPGGVRRHRGHRAREVVL